MDRPWKQRADELEPKEGMWSDYAAWREWFCQKGNATVNPGDILGELDKTTTIDPINLYTIFCDVYDKAEDEEARLRGLIDRALQAPTWPACLSILHDALAGVTGADDPRVVERVKGSVQP